MLCTDCFQSNSFVFGRILGNLFVGSPRHHVTAQMIPILAGAQNLEAWNSNSQILKTRPSLHLLYY